MKFPRIKYGKTLLLFALYICEVNPFTSIRVDKEFCPNPNAETINYILETNKPIECFN